VKTPVVIDEACSVRSALTVGDRRASRPAPSRLDHVELDHRARPIRDGPRFRGAGIMLVALPRFLSQPQRVWRKHITAGPAHYLFTTP
jgi:hypothetical protein